MTRAADRADAVRAALVAEFGAALEAVLGTPVTVATSAAGGGLGWRVPVTVDGAAAAGTLTAWVDGEGATRVARGDGHR